MLKKIKEELTNIFIKEAEYVDDVFDIFEVNGFYQNKRKYAAVIGGYIGQWVLVMSYFNKKVPDFINQEKIVKILDLFVAKCPGFHLLYTQADFEYFKTLDPNINAIDDIFKCAPDTLNTIVDHVFAQCQVHDPVLKLFLEELEATGHDDCSGMLSLYTSTMKKYMSDPSNSDKIKLLLKEGIDDYKAIGILNVASINKPKIVKKTLIKNPKAPVKIEFEPDFYDKGVILPSNVDTNRMIVYNPHFEKMLRHNIFECCNLFSKIESADKEVMKPEFEIYAEELEKTFLNKIALTFNNLPVFDFDVNPQQQTI